MTRSFGRSLSILFNLPIPLIATQLLWLNLVTNGVQDVALAFEPGEGNELKKPPRSPNERIFNLPMIKRLLIDGLLIGILAFITFKWLIDNGSSTGEARNMTLLLMVLFENINALNSRSENQSIFKINFFSNPLLIGSIILAQALHIAAMYLPVISDILQISPITFNNWITLLTISCLLLLTDELYKLWQRRKN
ncbi:MAG: magnesium-transporting ATPase (P-type) [Rickettsiales bacterium]